MAIKTQDRGGSALDLFLKKLAGKYSKYLPGDLIIAEGDRGNTMLLILSGTAMIFKKSNETRQPIVIAKRTAGEFIGEMALVEESPRFASVMAETDCEVLEFSKENFEKIIMEQPSFATRVLESLSHKLRESDSSRMETLEMSTQELIEANDKLSKLNAFLDSVIDHSPLGIILANQSGKVYRMNKAVRRIFGLKKEGDYTVDRLFTNFSFENCRLNLRGTWSGEVKADREGEEVSILLSCSLLAKQTDDVLYLLTCQDFAELSGLDGLRISEERVSCAQQSVTEFAEELLMKCSLIRSELNELKASHDMATSGDQEFTAIAMQNTLDSLSSETRKYLSMRDIESDFVFVDMRILMKTLLKFCQSRKCFREILFDLKVEPGFPRRLNIREVPMQNSLLSLLSAGCEAIISEENQGIRTLHVRLTTSENADYAEVRIFPENVHVDSAMLLTALTNRWFFGRPYIDKIIQRNEGKFLIENEPGGSGAFVIRLPLRPAAKDA